MNVVVSDIKLLLIGSHSDFVKTLVDPHKFQPARFPKLIGIIKITLTTGGVGECVCGFKRGEDAHNESKTDEAVHNSNKAACFIPLTALMSFKSHVSRSCRSCPLGA